MSLTADELYGDLSRRLPRWVFGGETAVKKPLQSPLCGQALLGGFLFLEPVAKEVYAKDPVYGPLVEVFGECYRWFQEELLAQTRVSQASGEWLELHATERGTARQREEDDERLRARLRRVPDACTEAALAAAAESVCDGEVESFTLRMREGVWGRGFFDSDRRWAGMLAPLPRSAGRATGEWDRAFLDLHTWADFGSRRPFEDPSGWLTAVVIVEPQRRVVFTWWNKGFFDFDFWGDSLADASRYAALRRLLEERKAGGVDVQIWIEETG